MLDLMMRLFLGAQLRLESFARYPQLLAMATAFTTTWARLTAAATIKRPSRTVYRCTAPRLIGSWTIGVQVYEAVTRAPVMTVLFDLESSNHGQWTAAIYCEVPSVEQMDRELVRRFNAVDLAMDDSAHCQPGLASEVHHNPTMTRRNRMRSDGDWSKLPEGT